MNVDQAATVDEEPILDVDEIQGNVIAGFNKDHQVLVAVTFGDVAGARRWLRRLLPHVASAREVLAFNDLFRRRRARLGGDPPGLVATWVNVALSVGGLAKLTSPAEATSLPDVAFTIGLEGPRAAGLGDPEGPDDADPTTTWVVGGTGRVPDALLIVASDDAEHLADLLGITRPSADDDPGAPTVTWEEAGATRPDLPGHEHFGFRDGISQPGVRGRVSTGADEFLTPRLLTPPSPGAIAFASPGEPLVAAGHFVLGYPTQDDVGAPIAPAAPTPAWSRNGSFLVFRRLRQDVDGFERFLTDAAKELATRPAFAGIDAGALGAALVGRWPSGAPFSRAPDHDDPALGADDLANNDFLFTTATPAPSFVAGAGPAGAFPLAVEDTFGLVCPHAAHNRKVNPRDQPTDVADAFDTLRRRILRRGIPFGPPRTSPRATPDPERGLHFLCYQASITDQFEFLQKQWANNPSGPSTGGVDLIIGQPSGALEMTLSARDGSGSATVRGGGFVTPTGGGYFFAPSLSALRDVLAKG